MATAQAQQKIPETMKAAAIDEFGPPDVLSVHELPVPTPEPNQVLIAVYSAGIGVWDASIRDGSWRPGGRPKLPLVLGSDGAGIVAAKGARARRFRVGDRVYGENAETFSGFYAEYVAVDASTVAFIPKPLDLLAAGATPVTGLTALEGIDNALRVRQDQIVLIFGASGAVGTLAVQFAKRRRAFVIGASKGRDATSLVRRLGADEVINTQNDDAVDRLQEIAPDGLDAVLALAGGDMLERFLDHLRPGGHLAYPNGVEPEPRRRKEIRVHTYDGEAGRRQFERLDMAIRETRLRVPIAATYPLAQAAKAHQRLEQGHILGRLVFRVRRGR